MIRVHDNYLAKAGKLVLSCIPFLLFSTQLYAKDVSFIWEANEEPVSGYKLYYKVGENSTPPYDGTGINEGNSPIILENINTYTITGLSPDQTYHFTLTAFNDSDESGYTTIVTVFPEPRPIIINIVMNR
jgi:hypothetical protein